MTEQYKPTPEDQALDPQHLLTNFVHETSRDHNLNLLISEQLMKFAHMGFRLRQINQDFSDPSIRERVYSDWGEVNPKANIRLTRDYYVEYTDIITKMAINLFDLYLSGSLLKRAASKDVLDFLNEQFKIK